LKVSLKIKEYFSRRKLKYPSNQVTVP
jgi:hypothetical protein